MRRHITLPAMILKKIPLLVVAVLLTTFAPALATAQVRTTRAVELTSTPGGTVIAELRSGARLTRGATRGSSTEVTIEGFVASSLLGGRRDTFAISVSAPSGANLRATGAANGEILALLRDGMGVNVLSRAGSWARVRRTGFVATSALPPLAPVANAGRGNAGTQTAGASTPPAAAARQDTGTAGQPPAAGEPATAGQPPTAGTPGNLTPSAPAELRTAPGGNLLGELRPGADLTPLARQGGWVRVRVDGWIRADALSTADPALRQLSAADIMADPTGSVGTVVEWAVEVVAFQRADPLRRGLRAGEPYLLARGPGNENALLYLALPQSLVATAQAIPALTQVFIVASVRTGKSEPAGVPILDVRTIRRR
jgi:hypothetical protein